MSQVEDWSEGDFDLDHTALRTDSTSLQDVHPFSRLDLDGQPDWDEDFPDDDPDENSDEQTDTIKLSTAAGSALKLILEANKASTSAAHESLEDQLRPPALDLARISQFANMDHTTGPASEARAYSTGSLSTSGSTSGLSMMAFSTDLTDPDTPNSKQSAHQASSISSRSSINARSDLDDPPSDLGDAIEMDFDLAPDMNNLSLCSSLSRARSNTSLSHVSRDLWDDDPAPLTSTTHTSSSSLHPPAFPDHPPSGKSVSGESDADDEHEDMLDGLDFEGSVFETQSAASAASAPGIKAKLEAILDLKRSGPSSAVDDPRQTTDSDTGIAAGLVIDDDFDLSPSRIAARGLPSKPYFPSVHAHNSALIGGSGSSASHGYERRHPVRSASDSPAQAPSTRSEVRASNRNRLSIKRSTSDLHSHANPSTTSSTFRRPPTRGSQLTRKRSLPSVRTTPPTHSPSGAAPPTLNARAPSVRQRHNSGNADASTNWRSRGNVGSRLTDSTAASRARAAETAADQLARLQRDASAPARPSTPTSFNPRSTHQPASRISVNTRAKARSHLERRMSSGESQPVARLLKRSVLYGNGAELDGIDDLPSSSSPQTSQPPASSSKSSQHKPVAKNHSDAPAVPGENQRKRGGRRGKRGKPALIRPLGAGATPAQKTVKGMRWNAQALRWEGNEGVLRDFDQVIQRSTRPALISQMTGSSTSSALNQAAGYSSPLSPESSTLMNSIASGARVVGDMLFDPIQMRWIQKSGDEEEDVFAGFDDALEDADDFLDGPTTKLGVDGDSTLRARRTRSTEAFSLSSNPWTPLSGKQRANQDTDAVIRQALLRGMFASNVGIDREFWNACVEAEKRHAVEVDGLLPQSRGPSLRSRTHSQTSDRLTMEEIDRPRPHLYYLENIAKSIVKPDGRS